jgi:NACalpha-BTF3-like transcription factor
MLTSDMKYVVFSGRNGEQIIIFPKVIQHSVMADNVTESSFGNLHPISGGFIVNGKCVGESESLRMVSREEADTVLIPALLDMDYEPLKNTPLFNTKDIKELISRTAVSKNKAKALRKKGKSVRHTG